MFSRRNRKSFIVTLSLLTFIAVLFYYSSSSSRSGGDKKIIKVDKSVLSTTPGMDIEKIFSKVHYSHLNLTFHVSKLISTFQCSNESLKLLILVTSAVSNFKRRETVRKTWGKTLQTQANNDFKTFFAVGKTKDKDVMKKVNEESDVYKDIIFGDFDEIFYNLPYKVETGFEWAYKHCSFDYYLKADDDVFVNLSNLFELLDSKDTPKKKLYLGKKHFGALALRSGKYKVTFEEYSKRYYPEFCSGGGFIFSSDVVKNVIPYFRKKAFKLDDVYISMLAMNAGIKSRNNENFKFFETTCVYVNSYITHHSSGITSERSCMKRLFYSMLNIASNSSFIKTHYGFHI